MHTKWTLLSVITLLLFVILVPVIASLGAGHNIWMWWPSPITPEAQAIGTLFNWVLFLTAILFIDIHAIMIYFAFRYPRQDGEDVLGPTGGVLIWAVIPTILVTWSGYVLLRVAQLGGMGWFITAVFFVIHVIFLYYIMSERGHVPNETSDVHGHLGIEITWTIIPTILMIILGIYSFEVYSQVTQRPADPVQIDVEGKQFQWTTEFQSIDVDGPDLTNRVVFPSERPIRLALSSPDVLHSFYVPELRTKQDVVPGMATHINIKNINRTGVYDIKCAELCGVGHYRMMADLIVVKPELYERLMTLTPEQFKLWRRMRMNKLREVWMELSGEEFDRWIRRWQQLLQEPETGPSYEQQLDIWNDLSVSELRAWTNMSRSEFEQWLQITDEQKSRDFLKKVSA